jgi:predicted permease
MLWVKEWEGDTSDRATNRDFNYMMIRRKAGMSWPQVEAELDSFGDWLVEQYPEANAKFAQGDFRVRPEVLDAPSQSVTIMTALLAVVGLVLLIACANVSTLLLIKGIRRQGEIAVRKALGASTLRLIGQHLTESVTLWILGGVAGTALALVLMRLVDRNVASFAGMVWFDARVLTFVGVLSLTVGLLFGVLPALAVTRVRAARWIGRGTTMVTGGRGRLRGAMTALQLAVTLTLLVGALLTHRTLDALAAVDLGFEPRGVTVFRVSTGRTRYDDNGRVEYYRSMLRGLRADPSVADASLALMVPFLDGGVSATVRVAGDEGAGASVLSTPVGPRFFETLGIALRAGRSFTDEESFDPVRDHPVVLGALTARRLFGDGDPLGELVEFEHEQRAGIRHRVIGVVEDVRFTPSSLTADFEPLVYEPFPVAGQISAGATFMARARPGAGNVGAVIRATAASVDENTRVTGLRPYMDAVARWYGDTALLAALSAATAVLAAILAAVGLYGVVGVAADARMREFGIRVALGAGPRTLMVAVVRQALGVVLAGLLLGAAGSYALGVLIESFLYGVTPLDPVSWALAALFLALVAAVAIIAPARRATALDPVEVLRAG